MEKICLFFGEFFLEMGKNLFQTDGSIQICGQKFGCWTRQQLSFVVGFYF
jgi:hypothetical protein